MAPSIAAIDLDALAQELAPYVRDEVGREFLELPPVRRVTRAAAQQEWRRARAHQLEVFDHLEPEQAAELVAAVRAPAFDHEYAFYSFADQTIYLVDEAVSTVAPALQAHATTCIVAHELVHALQDQYSPTPMGWADDRFSFVVEGQASLWGQRACAAARGPTVARLVASELGLIGSLSQPADLATWRYAEARLWAMAVERAGGRSALWHRLEAPPVDTAEVRQALGTWGTPTWHVGGPLDRAVQAAITAEALTIGIGPEDPGWTRIFTQNQGKDGRIVPLEEIYGVEFESDTKGAAVLLVSGMNTTVDALATARALCADVGGRWTRRDRLCTLTETTRMTIIRSDPGAALQITFTGPKLGPAARRILLAAAAAAPAHSQAGEVLTLADRAPAPLPVEPDEPGWPWQARSAFTAEAAGDPDLCVRIAAPTVRVAPDGVRDAIVEQLLRCAWDARDPVSSTEALESVAAQLDPGDVRQVVARLIHTHHPDLALGFLDAGPARDDEETNGYRVQALVAAGRVEDALALWRTRPVDADASRVLAAALTRAGRRTERAQVCGSAPDVCR